MTLGKCVCVQACLSQHSILIKQKSLFPKRQTIMREEENDFGDKPLADSQVTRASDI